MCFFFLPAVQLGKPKWVGIVGCVFLGGMFDLDGIFVHMWEFPEMTGYPHIIYVHVGIFDEINHPAIGDPPFLETTKK